MPKQIIVSLKEGASAEKLEAAKKKVTDSGGKIIEEYKLIKGFTAQIPDDAVSTLEADSDLNVENDGIVTTQ